MDEAHEADFEGFVASRWQPLKRVAFLLTGDWGHAEDLVQSTLANCYRRWPRIVAGGAQESYVRAAMVNAYISATRRRRFRELVTLAPPERGGGDEAHVVDDRDLLRRALRLLTPRTRAAVVLRYYVDLSEQETAAVMSCSVGNVKRLSSDGLRRLRDHLAPAAAATVTGDHPTSATTTAQKGR
jgi:RNA polymerase sigma-70 factor (sigma-E family)